MENIQKNNMENNFDGKIHIISDEKFFALLTDLEYQLYTALKAISYHNNRGKHHLFDDQINFNQLSEELELNAGKNKNGEDSVVSRQTISKTFKSLVEKKVLTEGTIFEDRTGYFIIDEKDYKFTRINKVLMIALTKALKGQVIKCYIYLKANFENAKRNGKNSFFINRETLALAINEVSKKGDIGQRQLKNITAYTTILYNLGLLDICVNVMKKDGKYSSCYQINNVADELKKIPTKRRA